jgi:hypothetical protein
MKPQSVKMYLLRASLWLAIVSCLTVFSLHVFKLKQRIERTEAALKQQSQARHLAESQLTTVNAALNESRSNLEAEQRARAQAEADALAQERRAEKLTRDLSASHKEYDQLKAELARYQAPGLSPEQILYAATNLKKLQIALADAEKEKELLKQRPGKPIDPIAGENVLLPAGLKAKIVRYDPKWGFVVLDTGTDQGMRKNAQLLVGREGNFVGKITISTVAKQQSIGNLLSGWQLSEVAEGDLAIPAFVGQN